MYPPAAVPSTREAVPIPPLKSKHCIPVPAPMQPSSTGPGAAASSAAATSSSLSGNERTSESRESSHSVTTGMTSLAPSGSRVAIHRTVASYAFPIWRDDVSTIGLISRPHSRSWFTPISSP